MYDIYTASFFGAIGGAGALVLILLILHFIDKYRFYKEQRNAAIERSIERHPSNRIHHLDSVFDNQDEKVEFTPETLAELQPFDEFIEDCRKEALRKQDEIYKATKFLELYLEQVRPNSNTPAEAIELYYALEEAVDTAIVNEKGLHIRWDISGKPHFSYPDRIPFGTVEETRDI